MDNHFNLLVYLQIRKVLYIVW